MFGASPKAAKTCAGQGSRRHAESGDPNCSRRGLSNSYRPVACGNLRTEAFPVLRITVGMQVVEARVRLQKESSLCPKDVAPRTNSCLHAHPR
jgi:hypothetical protein